ncbi:MULTISPECIES: type II toxin-antitoxin system YhaV family toxin [unclassified Methylobacterium]|uniref:type II toxin-antitoxin system YhaV family toxin n=1 Tax=unclassified Methylobacterium TaxID=2615210 RepID=UPI00135344EC|nr:type II toxin-antitoxin system YhaV family toxin [Methylobacterium sp. 2A]
MSDAALIVNGWAIYAHPLLLDALEGFVAEVEAARTKDPDGYRKKRSAKLLAAALKLAFELIPADPARTEYRQGDTLGGGHRHRFRVKFRQQYRLAVRYRDADGRKMIVLAWVNDEQTLRAYGSRTDAYTVFRKMLRSGNPPDDWAGLLKEASDAAARLRLGGVRSSRT